MRLSRRGKRRLMVISAMVALGGAGVSVWRGVRTAQIQRLASEARIEGIKAYSDGDYATALGKLSYYLTHRKDDLEALLALAEVRAKLPEPNARHLMEAVGLYRAALKIDVQNREALGSVLQLYRRLGARLEWIDIADRILSLDGNDADALSAKAVGLLAVGRHDEALQCARRLSTLHPLQIRWRALELEILRAQDVSDHELIQRCDAWVADYDGDGRFGLLKARTLAVLGFANEARAAAKAAAQRGADSLEVLQLMVNLLDQLRLDSEAGEVVARARTKFPQEQWVVEWTVRRLWQAQRIDDAMAELVAAEKRLSSLDAGLLRCKALLLMHQGRNEDARRALDSLIELAGREDQALRAAHRAWALALRARIDSPQSDWLATLGAYRRALALQPGDSVLYYLTGEAYASIEEHELAAAAFKQSMKFEPHWIAAQLAYAKSMLILGRATEALATVGTLIQRAPGAGLATYLLLARAWLGAGGSVSDVGLLNEMTGKPVDIVGLLEVLNEQSAGDPNVAALLLEAYVASDRRSSAVTLIEEALSREDPDPELLLHFAMASEQGQLGFEQQLIDRARRITGLTLRIAEAQARLLHRGGRTEEGLALINEASASAADHAGLAAQASRLRAAYLAWTQHPRAGAAMAQLLEAQPDSAEAATFVLSQPSAWDDVKLISQAIQHLRRLVGETSPRVLLARARYLFQFESHDAARLAKATVLVSDVLMQTPGSLPALTLMAVLQLTGEQTDPHQAIRHLQRAIELYPGRLDLYPRLAALLQQQGDFDTAERYLRRLGDRPHLDPRLRWEELKLLGARGDFDTAVLRLAEIVDESSAELDQLVLAALHQRAGNYDLADRVYQRLLAPSDRGDMAVRLAADFYANTGRFNDGLALLHSIQPGGADPAAKVMALGAFYQEHGDPDEAGRWLRQAVEIAPDDANAWNRLAQHFLTIDQYAQARSAALSGLEADPTRETLRATLAMAGLRLGGSARQQALELIPQLGEHYEPWLATVNLYDQVARDGPRPAPTARDLARAQELVRDHSHFLPAWRLAVILHAEAGDRDEAVRLARQAASRLPGRAEPDEWATRLLIEAGRPAEALDLARTWRRKSLHRPIAADMVIASLLSDLGRPDSAVDQLAPHGERIWAERERFPDRMAVWLRAVLLTGQFRRRPARIEALLFEDERWQSVWLDATRTADADVASGALLFIEPVLAESPEGMLALAAQWMDLARRTDEPSYYDRAEQLADEAGTDEQSAIPAAIVSGSIAVQRGDFAAAESIYRRLLRRDPTQALVLNNLAYVLLQQGGRYDEAAVLSAQAIELDPDNPDLLDTHAQALAGTGRLGEAEAAARHATAERSDDPGLLMTLTEVLVSQSRLDEAEAQLQRARRILSTTRQPDDRRWAKVDALRDRIDRARSGDTR